MTGTKFLILFSGRCGGTLVQRSLNNHPNAICEGEILQEKSFSEQIGTLDWVYSKLGHKTLAAGLKTKLMETRFRDYPGLTSYIKENSVKIIHLYRENPLKHTLSHLTVRELVKKTNAWEVYRDEDRAAPITVDIQKFSTTLAYIEEFERRTHCFALQFDEVFHLSYEKLSQNIQSTLAEVQEFLGLPVRDDIVEPMKKLTADDLSVAIGNYTDFSRNVYRMMELGGPRDSGYYPYLDDRRGLMERLIKAEPENPDFRLEAAALALDEQDLETARHHLRKARELVPDDPSLAELEVALGELD